ncbi:MAG TPA: tRNA lysidine(34) synthetase TilS [Xanthobacteraceae bacterium]|nr:tRNA lysidine(34) synthetase TilS [Xanthobacteraceae bacterium]
MNEKRESRLSDGSEGPVSAREAAALFADLAATPALVLAVSGGPDSTALLLLIARWRARLKTGPKLLAVTVDHRLRPESAAEAAAVARLARRLKVAHRILRWTAKKPKTGLQAAARTARYRLLAQAAREAGAHHVLTAHTRDDQAETVLIRLARGSGLAGLAAMARVSPLPANSPLSPGREGEILLVRPLLDMPKARLVATLKAARIPFAEDPSNRNVRFARSRIRELMPALAQEGLTAARLSLFARRMSRANAAIEHTVDAAYTELQSVFGPGPLVFDAAAFGRAPEEIALRVLGRAIARRGDEGPVELGKLEALCGEIAAQLGTNSPRLRRTLAGALITLEGDRLLVDRAPPRRAHRAPLTKRKGGRRKVAGRR